MLDLEATVKSPSKLRQLHLLSEIYRESQDWDRRQVPQQAFTTRGTCGGSMSRL